MPIDKVIAKPLIGPVPKPNSMIAAIRVVRLESMMVSKARSKPAWIAACGLLPLRSSSRIRS